MSQSKTMSFIEAKTNAVIGLIVSWLFTYYALPLFGIHPDVHQATVITVCYFLLSLGRGYILRRVFNLQGRYAVDKDATGLRDGEIAAAISSARKEFTSREVDLGDAPVIVNENLFEKFTKTYGK